jgi:hypothetical protein
MENDAAMTDDRFAAVSPSAHPTVGLAIYTADGRRLGRVKRAAERCIQVDARFAFDYWISRRAVAAVENDQVLLGIERARVGTYLVDPDCIEDEDLEPVTGSRLGLLAVPG